MNEDKSNSTIQLKEGNGDMLANPYFSLFAISYMKPSLDNDDIRALIKQIYIQSPHRYFIKRIRDFYRHDITILEIDIIQSTVRDVKNMIFKKEGLKVARQILYCPQDRLLKDEIRLIDYPVLHGQTIKMQVTSEFIGFAWA